MKKVKYLILLLTLLLSACTEFLNEKPNKRLVTPRSLADLQAILDDTNQMNGGKLSGLIEMGTDDFWLELTAFNSLRELEKSVYLWARDLPFQMLDANTHWTNSYGVIMYCNTVLEELRIFNQQSVAVDQIQGAALFHRAFAYYQLVQLYSPTYMDRNDAMREGLPLRLSTDVNVKSVRSTLSDTYAQILDDAETSLFLLPLTTTFKTRPNKCAANALLARICLSMERYEEALQYALDALAMQDDLLDFSLINATAPIPFERFNAETIFFSYGYGTLLLNPPICNISDRLLQLYTEKDLRRAIYFQNRGTGRWSFKGGYEAFTNTNFFLGLATDELYLIAAECYVRANELDKGLAYLNALTKQRFAAADFSPYAMGDQTTLLTTVLQERRRELVFRGVRWSDLRRLNRDPRFRKDLYRDHAEDLMRGDFSLPALDSRYVYPIPQDIIARSGMNQNIR